MVKDLRERTGVGMMDCKKALTECDGDEEKAIAWLREKGLSKAAKKAGRATSEGLVTVVVAADGKSAAMSELKCETDFVSKNEEFIALAEGLAHARPGKEDRRRCGASRGSLRPDRTHRQDRREHAGRPPGLRVPLR